jgi:NAD(P)-dependent dehydrogenase (short-subunit alcohol dehydrogenase family)
MDNKIIVITGSTRGIGFGLADSFLALGCAVVISGRQPQAVEQAIAKLSSQYGTERILGHPCDVTNYNQVQSLWDIAKSHFGRVDIWINNAGISHPRLNFWEQPPDVLETIIQTNILGVMYGSKVALTGMLAQGSGAVYNVEGLGSDGRLIPKMGIYGSTKAGLHYFNRALVNEVEGTPVLVGIIRPGMVLTDMLMGENARSSPDWEANQRIFSILAEPVEVVTPFLARKILVNHKNGTLISYLTGSRALMRFLTMPFKMQNSHE